MARGRPRKFDEDKALTGAMLLFWQKGLSATSLDDLAIAMGMNRPSIYNAFGNKDEIYRKALARFCGQLDLALQALLEEGLSLQRALIDFFDQAIDVYCGANPPMGCLMICTAPTEALSHPEVGADLKSLIDHLDDGFKKRLQRGQHDGDLDKETDTRLTAQLLQAVLHSIAIRARAGTPKTILRKLSRYAVANLVA